VELSELVAGLRATVTTRTTTVAWRRDRLQRLRRLLTDNLDAIGAALRTDLGKPATETAIAEIAVVVGEIDHLLRRVRRAARRRPVAVPAQLLPARAWTVREPYGVVLVIAPWNYPINLTLAPVAGAMAAGNTVLLKPSELAPATSALLAELISKDFDRTEIAVVEGGKDVTTAVLQQRFDLIFYTGGQRVGRIVAEAAARHLTPTVLELGGKSPVWVDDTVDLALAARRIVWGKLMNTGQTCVAPDYLICTPAVARRLEPLLWQEIHRQYGTDPQLSADYGRIVSAEAAGRLRSIAGLGEPVAGDERVVPPRVLTHPDQVARAMEQEIFGPLLPIVTVDGRDPVGAAVEQINRGDKPLALYVFSSSRRTRREFERHPSSGAIAFGVPNAHLMASALPFGGVGASGYGAYHGRWSLDTFSHRKAGFSKPLHPDTLRLVYPPLGATARRFARVLLRRR
jgi:aldehyde dehydrogenase (NAD+)